MSLHPDVDSSANIFGNTSNLPKTMTCNSGSSVTEVNDRMLKLYVDMTTQFNDNPSGIYVDFWFLNAHVTISYSTFQNYSIRAIRSELVGHANVLLGIRSGFTSSNNIKMPFISISDKHAVT